MSRPLALLRPEPGWSASATAARAAGIEVIGHPLFDAEPVLWEPPAGDFDALLVGSAAAFRRGGGQLAGLSGLPVHAVGEATAEAAREAGFRVAKTGVGGLQALLDAERGRSLRFLRLAGEDRVALAAHEGQRVTERVVYRMVPRSIASDFATELTGRCPVVALHSAIAACHFAAEADRLALARGSLFLLALGPRVATEAGLGWAAVHVADAPSEAALLAKAAALCK